MSGFGGQQRGGARGGGGGSAGWDPFTGSMGGGPGAGFNPGRSQNLRGEDVNLTATVTLEEAHAGGSVPLRMPTGKTLNVKLPEKVEEGQQIRLKGQGIASPLSGEAGDAIVTVKFERHKQFRRDGADLRVDLPIALYEAVLGGKVRVPTLDGAVELAVPAGSSSGRTFRLKGKGLPGGDLLVALRIALPQEGDEALAALMRKWRDEKPYDPRSTLT
jgi:DnaJ-class molecular chaperone